MAGHRRRSGKPDKPTQRIERFQLALELAPTTEAQAAIAFDWWRVAFRRDPGELRRVAEMLAALAHGKDREAART